MYFVRHGEQEDQEHGIPDGPLSERGRTQAELIGERLSRLPITRAWHSPLQRAEETANIIAGKIEGVQSEPSALLLDCFPSGPVEGMPSSFESFFGGITEAQLQAGSAQMSDAVHEWLSPTQETQHELLVTHNFVIAWFVREVLHAPDWVWMTLNASNASLTVIRVRSGRPNTVVGFNDVGHLPYQLRSGLSLEAEMRSEL